MHLRYRSIQLRNLPQAHSTDNHHSTFQHHISSVSSCQLGSSNQADTYSQNSHLSLLGKRNLQDIFWSLAKLVSLIIHTRHRNNQLDNLCKLYFNPRSYKFQVGKELGLPFLQYLQYIQCQGLSLCSSHRDSRNQLDKFCKSFTQFNLDIFQEGTIKVMLRVLDKNCQQGMLQPLLSMKLQLDSMILLGIT